MVSEPVDDGFWGEGGALAERWAEASATGPSSLLFLSTLFAFFLTCFLRCVGNVLFPQWFSHFTAAEAIFAPDQAELVSEDSADSDFDRPEDVDDEEVLGDVPKEEKKKVSLHQYQLTHKLYSSLPSGRMST